MVIHCENVAAAKDAADIPIPGNFVYYQAKPHCASMIRSCNMINIFCFSFSKKKKNIFCFSNY